MTGLFRITLTIALTGACAVLAQAPHEVYVSTGENGEVSFSDVAAPGAERMELTPPEPPEGAILDLERRIEQTLSVAKVLEESRLAREKARADARRQAAQAQPEPQVVYQDRYVGYPYVLRSPYDRRFPRRAHPGDRGAFDKWPHRHRERDREPPERTRSRPFIYDPD